MGLSGMSPWLLLLILLIVVLLFGTKRIRTLGSDMGHMIRDFNQSMKYEKDSAKDDPSAKEQTFF